MGEREEKKVEAEMSQKISAHVSPPADEREGRGF
jgi:hypothetical protein